MATVPIGAMAGRFRSGQDMLGMSLEEGRAASEQARLAYETRPELASSDSSAVWQASDDRAAARNLQLDLAGRWATANNAQEQLAKMTYGEALDVGDYWGRAKIPGYGQDDDTWLESAMGYIIPATIAASFLYAGGTALMGEGAAGGAAAGGAAGEGAAVGAGTAGTAGETLSAYGMSVPGGGGMSTAGTLSTGGGIAGYGGTLGGYGSGAAQAAGFSEAAAGGLAADAATSAGTSEAAGGELVGPGVRPMDASILGAGDGASYGAALTGTTGQMFGTGAAASPAFTLSSLGGMVKGALPYVSMAQGAYGLIDARRQRKLAEEEARMSDPWGTSGGRAVADAQLQELLKDPSLVSSRDPSYALRQQAAKRAAAIYGQDSGAMAVAAANASTDWYNEKLAALGGLAGAGMNPGGARQIGQAGRAQADTLAQRSLGQIGYGMSRASGGSMSPEVAEYLQSLRGGY